MCVSDYIVFKIGTVGWKIFLFCKKLLYGVNWKTQYGRTGKSPQNPEKTLGWVAKIREVG